MGDPAIAPPAIEEVEAQLLGTSPMDTLSLDYRIAKTALVRAYIDLTILQDYYESQVETSSLPVAPNYVTRRVEPALLAGSDALQSLSDIPTTTQTAPGIAEYVQDARFILLQYIRHHMPTSFPAHLARFELQPQTKKRPFTRPSRTKHGPRRQYLRHHAAFL